MALETNYIERSTMAINPNMDVAAATTETPSYLITSITYRSNTSLVENRMRYPAFRDSRQISHRGPPLQLPL